MGMFKQQPSEQTTGVQSSEIAATPPAFTNAKRFAFSTRDPLNREITEVDGNTSYKIHTRATIPIIGSDITTITRIESGLETEIAKIDWHHYEDDQSDLRYTHYGMTMKLWEYLKGPDTVIPNPHASRTFRLKEQEYSWVWTHDDPHLELVDTQDRKLARDIREKGGLFLPYTRSGGLLVNPEGLLLLDEVIVTLTAIGQLQRMEFFQRRDATAATYNTVFKF